jgi:antitoxin component YwqK of YwqJK toxin-antitoxin module
MKIIYILVFCYFVSGCSDVSKNTESGEVISTVLDVKNGIAFLPNENEPFTGKYETYYSNGIDLELACTLRSLEIARINSMVEEQLNVEISAIGIKENGLYRLWRKINKTKCIEENYKNGKKNGLTTEWNENGQKEYEQKYKDGKLNGLQIYWHTNGQKGKEENYKDGKKNGLVTAWRDNGEILYTVNHIDGKLDKNFHANKSEQKTSDSMQELISRCRTQMGEYGAAIVKACVDQDIEALQALGPYLENHEAITKRCLEQMIEHGYAIVKACADQDIEAEDALRKY